MEYDPTQFAGTAAFHLAGRPPYSAALGEVLSRELQLDGTGELVDVGSGPGTVGVPLAPLFAHTTLIEPDPASSACPRRALSRSRSRSIAPIGSPSPRPSSPCSNPAVRWCSSRTTRRGRRFWDWPGDTEILIAGKP